MTAAPLWLIQNVRTADRDGLWQIAVIRAAGEIRTDGGRRTMKALRGIERSRRAGVPPFIEPHIHLDTTDGEPNWNSVRYSVRGIERWAERALLSHEDVKAGVENPCEVADRQWRAVCPHSCRCFRSR